MSHHSQHPAPLRLTRIHVFGASGSGTSTIGRAIAECHGLPFFEVDDFFWESSDPPYQKARDVPKRQRLLIEALSGTPGWVLAGSLVGWGDAATSLFGLAVFVTAPTAIRLKRLRARETSRFGDRLLPTGDMHQQHLDFLTWASSYDDGGMNIRSRRLHEDWLLRLPCPVLRVDGTDRVEAVCAQVSGAVSTMTSPSSEGDEEH